MMLEEFNAQCARELGIEAPQPWQLVFQEVPQKPTYFFNLIIEARHHKKCAKLGDWDKLTPQEVKAVAALHAAWYVEDEILQGLRGQSHAELKRREPERFSFWDSRDGPHYYGMELDPVYAHRLVAERALSEGKPVPAEVLAPYPRAEVRAQAWRRVEVKPPTLPQTSFPWHLTHAQFHAALHEMLEALPRKRPEDAQLGESLLASNHKSAFVLTRRSAKGNIFAKHLGPSYLIPTGEEFRLSKSTRQDSEFIALDAVVLSWGARSWAQHLLEAKATGKRIPWRVALDAVEEAEKVLDPFRFDTSAKPDQEQAELVTALLETFLPEIG